MKKQKLFNSLLKSLGLKNVRKACESLEFPTGTANNLNSGRGGQGLVILTKLLIKYAERASKSQNQAILKELQADQEQAPPTG